MGFDQSNNFNYETESVTPLDQTFDSVSHQGSTTNIPNFGTTANAAYGSESYPTGSNLQENAQPAEQEKPKQ